MARDKRYENTKPFSSDPRGLSSFKGIRAREVKTVPGIIEHTVKSPDRLDHISTHYFSDDRLWYRAVDANWSILFGPDMALDLGGTQNEYADPLSRKDKVGRKILIPKARD